MTADFHKGACCNFIQFLLDLMGPYLFCPTEIKHTSVSPDKFVPEIDEVVVYKIKTVLRMPSFFDVLIDGKRMFDKPNLIECAKVRAIADLPPSFE